MNEPARSALQQLVTVIMRHLQQRCGHEGDLATVAGRNPSWRSTRGSLFRPWPPTTAALVDAFVRLAEATGAARWVSWAQDTADAMVKLFWDDEAGGLFTTGGDAERLITRAKDLVDNAVPSANGTAALALLRLSALAGPDPTGADTYRDRAEAILRLLAPVAEQHPSALTRTIAALDLASRPVTEVAVVGDRPDLVRVVHTRYLPNAVLAWGEPYRSPLFESRTAGPSGGLAYVCENYVCKAPVDGVEELVAALG